MRPAGSAPVVVGVQHDEAPAREPILQVVRGTDAGDTRPDDEDVDITDILGLHWCHASVDAKRPPLSNRALPVGL